MTARKGFNHFFLMKWTIHEEFKEKGDNKRLKNKDYKRNLKLELYSERKFRSGIRLMKGLDHEELVQ